MSFCIVSGCKNRKFEKNFEQEEKENVMKRPFSFHSLPKDIKKRQTWLQAIHLSSYDPPKWGAVCSAHFKEEHYEQNICRRILQRNAVPFLSEEYLNNLIETGKTLHEYNDETDNEQGNIEEISVSKTPNIHSDRIHRSTSISPDRIFNSPTKKRLRKAHKQEMSTLKRKLAISTYTYE